MLPPIAHDLGNEVLHLRAQPVCGAPKFAGARRRLRASSISSRTPYFIRKNMAASLSSSYGVPTIAIASGVAIFATWAKAASRPSKEQARRT